VKSIELPVRNPSGLHARPAALFVQVAARFASRVSVENLDRDGAIADGKSLLSLLATGVEPGHRVRIIADGPDEGAAIQAITSLLEGGLGEPSHPEETAGGDAGAAV
jgi:phosphotransferase system HPr (HPr) family protein